MRGIKIHKYSSFVIIVVQLLLVLLTPSFSFAVELGDSPEQKPVNCTTEFYDAKCATLSPGGYTMWTWTGPKGGELTMRKFNFVGTTDFRTMWTGDIGTYVYKQDGENFYYTVEKIGPLDAMTGFADLTITHHFRVGANTEWDEFAIYNKTYHVYAIRGDILSLPPYKNSFQTDDLGSHRFVWRVVATGKITLNGEPINTGGASDKAVVKIIIVSEDGPSVSEVASDTEGNYDFSASGLFNDQKFWVSSNTVSKIIIYVQLEKNDGTDKYEHIQSFNFTEDFRIHGTHDDTLVLNKDRDIDLADSNKVSSFSRAKGGEQSFLIETFGKDECGEVIEVDIAKMIARAFCGIGLMLHDAAKRFLDYSVRKLDEVIGSGIY